MSTMPALVTAFTEWVEGNPKSRRAAESAECRDGGCQMAAA